LELHCTGALKEAVEKHLAMIQQESLCVVFEWSATPQGKYTETTEIDEAPLKLALTALPRKS
jgi:hypothetical protein